jgi:hypothetical protein
MIMKNLIAILTLAFIAAYPTRVTAQSNLENDPAYLAIDKAFDFNTIKPEVNVNLPKFLLKDALADLDGGKNDPFAGSGINISELVQDIKLIRVVVSRGFSINTTGAARHACGFYCVPGRNEYPRVFGFLLRPRIMVGCCRRHAAISRLRISEFGCNSD